MGILTGEIEDKTLKDKIHYNRGDVVRAETINDIQDTAIDAHNMATEALDKADSVFQGNGTVVSVGDREVGTLAFTSDPQQQLDTLNSKIGTASSFNAEIVDQLPTENISTSTFYLIKNSTSADDNTYSEYLYVNGKWELLGNTQVQAYDDSELRELINGLSTTKANKTDLANYYTKDQTYNITEVDAKVINLVSTSYLKSELNPIKTDVNTNKTNIATLQTDIVGKADKADLNNYTKTSDLAKVATSNDYNDLDNTPNTDLMVDIINEHSDSINEINAELASKANKSEIPSISGLASETYVNTQVNTLQGKIDAKADKADLIDYATNEDLNKVAEDILDDIPDISGLASENYVQGVASVIHERIDGKQDIISDLATIRSGASAGATAVQPGTLNAQVSTLQASINNKVDKTTKINNKALSTNITLTASDVGALSNTTLYCASLSLTMNTSTYVVTAQLKDQAGNNLGTAQTIDLPLESVVVSGSYDDTNKKVVLTLKDGSTIDFSVEDLIDGLASQSSLDTTNANVSANTTSINTKGGLYRGTFDTWDLVPTDISGYNQDDNGNTTPLQNDYIVLNNGSGKLDDSSFIYQPNTTGGGASISNTYNGVTQTVVYYNVTGSANAKTLNNVVSVYYNSDTGKWVVTTLVDCVFNDTSYSANDIIAEWGYSSYHEGHIKYSANSENGGILVYNGVWNTNGKDGWNVMLSINNISYSTLNAIKSKTTAINNRLPLTGGDITGTINYIFDGNPSYYRNILTINNYGLINTVHEDGNHSPTKIEFGNNTTMLNLKGRQTNPTYNDKDLALKSDVITKTSQLENDAGFITTAPEGVALYETTGSNTDGAMTQKATTDELNKKVSKGTTLVGGQLAQYTTSGTLETTGITPTDVMTLSTAQTVIGAKSFNANNHLIATCSTAYSSTTKTASLTGFTSNHFTDGCEIYVKFVNGNTAGSRTSPVTLNVNSAGAKTMVVAESATLGSYNQNINLFGQWANNDVIKFRYDATYSYWVAVENVTQHKLYGFANTTLYSTTGTSETAGMTQKAITDALSGKANTSDIPDISNLATKDEIPTDYVKYDENTAVDTNVINPNYATKDDIPDISNLIAKVSGATANNLASLNSSGDVVDSGISKSNVALKSDIPSVSDYIKTSSNQTKGMKLSNGLILNWGDVTPSSSGTTVNFAVPFTTTTYAVGATNVSVNTSQCRALAVYTYNTASFVCKGQWSQNSSGISNGDVTFRWVAIGK